MARWGLGVQGSHGTSPQEGGTAHRLCISVLAKGGTEVSGIAAEAICRAAGLTDAGHTQGDDSPLGHPGELRLREVGAGSWGLLGDPGHSPVPGWASRPPRLTSVGFPPLWSLCPGSHVCWICCAGDEGGTPPLTVVPPERRCLHGHSLATPVRR